MTPRGYDGAVIAGYGELPVVKRTTRDTLSLLADAIRLALDSAGVTHDEVDGLAVGSFFLDPDCPVDVALHLGFDLTWFEALEPGGGSGLISILHAARAIQAGDAEVIVCVGGDIMPLRAFRKMVSNMNSETRDYLTPYGHGGASGVFALIQRQHMERYGTTLEQLAQVAVTERLHGSLNPNALWQSPITTEDYLSSRLIVDPIRLYDCVMTGCGASAVVVTAAGRTKAPKVRIAGGAERHNYLRDEYELDFAWQAMREVAYGQAGVGPEDIDGVQLYDNYPVMALIQLEDMGFCAKGESGPFVDRVSLRYDGGLPTNTGGGMLACGQAGAAAGFVAPIEAIRQLRGEGGRRQVNDARQMVISTLGMVGYRHPTTTAMSVFARDT